ncbi:uncharacterized protein [Dysidea avara]|uniref:uncharacterized protein n=1 Tax=Dysidea avara TaxID=196820 RepID=UPI0033270FA8
MRAENEEVSFEEWKQTMIKNCPTFQYWDLVLEFEILALIFIRAHRINDFNLYLESLKALTPWFFSLDHINYARWIPIHIRDMESLSDNFRNEFEKCWVLRKTHSKFSCIPIDQGHEQNNELVKGSGGAVGLIENPTAFRRWMVAGPEQARLLTEFESQFMGEENSWCKQHEQGLSAQDLFQKHANSMYQTMTGMGNPFKDNCLELLALDSHNCATEGVVETIRNIKRIGETQYQNYVNVVIKTGTVSIHKPIKKNSIPLLKRQSSKPATKSVQKIASLRSDCNLFSHLFIASKFRDGDLDDFFLYENHPWPPSISEHGKLCLPNRKAELLSCLGGSFVEAPITFHAKIFDGPAVVHCLPTKVSTFEEYANEVFLPWTS